jgi:hypothetical protein
MALIDYLVLTPLDEEWRAVRDALCPPPLPLQERAIGTITYYLWPEPVDRRPDVQGEYLVVATPMSRRTPGQAYAAAFTGEAIKTWKPSRVVMLGIAGSLDSERLLLGDVVVSEQVFGYEVGDARPSLDAHGGETG